MLKIIKFDSKGNNAPAYSCSEPYDQSGNYYKASDVEALKSELIHAEECGKPLEFVFKAMGL